MADSTKLGAGFDWSDTIRDTSESKPEPLPEGDYDFVISSFERDWYDGGEKIPACNMARLTLKVETDDGTTFIYTNLYLCKAMEWLLVAFFRSIGQEPTDGDLVMDWDHVNGAFGRAHIKPETYTDKDGDQHNTYQVRFLG